MKKDFQWTDDESELLLNIIYNHKATKALNNVDWESVKNKCEEILECLRVELPDEPPSAAVKEQIKHGLTRNYPHAKEEVIKQIVTTKLKALRQKCR